MPSTVDTWPTKDGFRVGYLNIRSAINKKDHIASILHNSGNAFHMFCFAESRLTDVMTKTMKIPGYEIEPLEPQAPLSTRLILYYSSAIGLKRKYSIEAHGIEAIWVEISFKGCKPILYGFLYRNPAERVDWHDRFNDMMDAAILENKELIMFGDFNIDQLTPDLKWKRNCDTLGLELLNDLPTRITKNKQSLIDHIYATCKQHITEICCPKYGCSDHFPICITWAKKHIKIPKAGHKEIYYRCFSKFDKDSFLHDLFNSGLEHVYQLRDPDAAIEHWINTFLSVYNRHAPFQKKRVRHMTKPLWLTSEIEKEIHYRDYLVKSGTHDQIQSQRNKITSLLRKSKMKYAKDLTSSSKSPKVLWNAINKLTNKSTKQQQQHQELPLTR